MKLIDIRDNRQAFRRTYQQLRWAIAAVDRERAAVARLQNGARVVRVK